MVRTDIFVVMMVRSVLTPTYAKGASFYRYFKSFMNISVWLKVCVLIDILRMELDCLNIANTHVRIIKMKSVKVVSYLGTV